MRLIMRWRDSAWAFVFWTGLVAAFPVTMTVEGLFSWSDPLVLFGLTVIWAVFLVIWLVGAIPIALVWYVAQRRDGGDPEPSDRPDPKRP